MPQTNEPLVRSIMLFEDANLIPAGNEQKMLMVQPILNFGVPFIPTQLSFVLLVAVSNIERGKMYNSEIQFLSPSGEIIYTQPWAFKDENTETIIPPSAMMISSIKNMIFEQEGTHRVIIIIDGKKIAEQIFDVFKQVKKHVSQ